MSRQLTKIITVTELSESHFKNTCLAYGLYVVTGININYKLL